MYWKRELDSDDPSAPAVDELYSSWALFIFVGLLIGTLWCSYYLQLRKIRAVHETVVGIFAGMVAGLAIRLSPGMEIQRMVSFKYTYFFNLLLPPIILNSGYELHQANFFRNFGTIITFAFLGTFISAVVTGTLVYLWAVIGLEGLDITFTAAMSVGATLSATDPVTVMAIFNSYKVDPKLYTIIFGESLLNDAIAIVMFDTLQRFQDQAIHLSNVFKGISIFIVIFTLSLVVGLVVGFATALVLKHSHLSRFPQIESCIIIMMAYGSYLFSNGCKLSGIVSLLFCGITLKHYAYHNMSRRAKLTTKYTFQTLAQLSENFIFIYLGISLFTLVDLVYKPLFIIVTMISICVARYCAVFPPSAMINWVIRQRNPDPTATLSHPHQTMLYWAGLRGAVGVALASGLNGEHGPALKATVLVVVVLTVIMFGGTTARMLEILGIRTGIATVENSSDSEDSYRAVEDNIVGSNQFKHLNEHDGCLNMQKHKGPSSSSSLDALAEDMDIGLVGTNLELDEQYEPSQEYRIGPPDRLTTWTRPSQSSSRNRLGFPDQQKIQSILTATAENPAQWFAEFDEHVLKPVLIYDNSRKDPSNNT